MPATRNTRVKSSDASTFSARYRAKRVSSKRPRIIRVSELLEISRKTHYTKEQMEKGTHNSDGYRPPHTKGLFERIGGRVFELINPTRAAHQSRISHSTHGESEKRVPKQSIDIDGSGVSQSGDATPDTTRLRFRELIDEYTRIDAPTGFADEDVKAGRYAATSSPFVGDGKIVQEIRRNYLQRTDSGEAPDNNS